MQNKNHGFFILLQFSKKKIVSDLTHIGYTDTLGYVSCTKKNQPNRSKNEKNFFLLAQWYALQKKLHILIHCVKKLFTYKGKSLQSKIKKLGIQPG